MYVCIYTSCICICIIIYIHIYNICGTVQFLQGKNLDGGKKAGWKDSMFRNNLFFYLFYYIFIYFFLFYIIYFYYIFIIYYI